MSHIIIIIPYKALKMGQLGSYSNDLLVVVPNFYAILGSISTIRGFIVFSILLNPCLPLFGFAHAPPEVWVSSSSSVIIVITHKSLGIIEG